MLDNDWWNNWHPRVFEKRSLGGEFAFLLSLCHSVTVHYVTALQCQRATKLQCDCVTVSLRYSVTVLQCHIVTVSQCHCVTVSPFYSVTVLQCNSVTMSNYYCVTVLQWYDVTLLQCHSVALWHHGDILRFFNLKSWKIKRCPFVALYGTTRFL